MNNAVRYEKVALKMQGREIKSLLKEFENELSHMNGLCVDIGCGPGNVTRKLILPKLSPEANIVGIDILKEMIDFARNANADEMRLTFDELDIETTSLCAENIERFDNGISFFCLHWIRNLRICFQNIFEMLRPGGHILIHYLLYMGHFQSYMNLAEFPKYRKYMRDVMQFINPLYFESNPVEVLTKIFKEVGFEILHCSLRQEMWEFKDVNERKELYYSVNPFIDRMPENMKEEFILDLFQDMSRKEKNVIQNGKNFKNVPRLSDMYKFLVIYVKKPSN